MVKRFEISLLLSLISGFVLGDVTKDDFAVNLSLKEGTMNTVVFSVDIDLADEEPTFIESCSFAVCHETDKASVKGCEEGAVFEFLKVQDPYDPIRAGDVCPGIAAGSGMDGLDDFLYHTARIVDGGVMFGIIFDMINSWGLESGQGIEMYEITYYVDAGQCALVRACNQEIGSPKVVNSFAYNSNTFLPDSLGEVTVCSEITELTFVRGDVNADGKVDIADPIYLLSALFRNGSELPCGKAADGNDDGTVDLPDAVALIEYFFSCGAAPPAPFPECGEDQTADELGCDSFSPCL